MSYGSLYSGSVSRLITLTNGQTTVACSGTVLTEENLRTLDTLAVGTGHVVKIASITDDDTFELLRPWAGTTQTLISTWDIIRDAPSRLDQVEAASAMTQAAGFAALVNGQTRQFRVESEGNGPPVSPVDGKYYLAGSAPSGWPITVTAGDIVKRRLGSYGVITPEEGWLAVILATGAVKRFKSGAWGVAAVTAADVAFTPTGGVAATTVQAAIAEVDSEKVTKASGTTAGRLWRFTDTAGGLGPSGMSDDGSGNVAVSSLAATAHVTAGTDITIGTGGSQAAGSIFSDVNWGMLFRAKSTGAAAAFAWNNSVNTQLMALSSTGLRVGTGATIGAKFDGGVHTTSQTSAVFSARGIPNAFEWGHQNGGGYACTFGFQSSSGAPYIVFNGEAGSTVINTIRTRGVKARGIIGDNAGGMSWFTVANANADDQAVVTDMKLTSGGNLLIGGATNGGERVTITAPVGGYGYIITDNTYATNCIRFSAGYGVEMGNIGGSPMHFITNNIQRISITTNGDIGFGTITPNKSSYGRALTINAAAGQIPVLEWAVNESLYGRQWANAGGLYIDTIGSIPINYRPAGGTTAFSIGTTAVTSSVAFAFEQASLTLSNGANQNVSRPVSSSLLVGGPTVAFNIGGLTGGSNGLLCELINTTAHQMTLNNEDASSTAGNRIVTDTGGNLNCKHAVLRYDATASRWRVISFRT